MCYVKCVQHCYLFRLWPLITLSFRSNSGFAADTMAINRWGDKCFGGRKKVLNRAWYNDNEVNTNINMSQIKMDRYCSTQQYIHWYTISNWHLEIFGNKIEICKSLKTWFHFSLRLDFNLFLSGWFRLYVLAFSKQNSCIPFDSNISTFARTKPEMKYRIDDADKAIIHVVLPTHFFLYFAMLDVVTRLFSERITSNIPGTHQNNFKAVKQIICHFNVALFSLSVRRCCFNHFHWPLA